MLAVSFFNFFLQFLFNQTQPPVAEEKVVLTQWFSNFLRSRTTWCFL